MLIIRETFTAKPGNASKLAKLMKKVMESEKGVRLMVDVISDFNTVVMETEVKNLAEFEKRMKEYESGEAFKDLDEKTRAEMSKYNEMYQTGRREIFRVL